MTLLGLIDSDILQVPSVNPFTSHLVSYIYVIVDRNFIDIE